jgi:anti-sigma B factor antagonist
MEIRVRTNSDKSIYIIDMLGEMDLMDANRLKDLVMKMIEKKAERFIINVKEIRTIDSSGIGALIYISSTLKKLNLNLAITNVQGAVKAVLDKTRLSGYFPIYEKIDQAIRDLSDA